MKAEIENKVNDILNSYSPQSDVFEPDARSIWLSEAGLLTDEYVRKMINRFYIIDKGIRYSEVDYDPHKFYLKVHVFLSAWSFLFRKRIVFNKLRIFSNINLTNFNVEFVFQKYKRNKYTGESNVGQIKSQFSSSRAEQILNRRGSSPDYPRPRHVDGETYAQETPEKKRAT